MIAIGATAVGITAVGVTAVRNDHKLWTIINIGSTINLWWSLFNILALKNIEVILNKTWSLHILLLYHVWLTAAGISKKVCIIWNITAPHKYTLAQCRKVLLSIVQKSLVQSSSSFIDQWIFFFNFFLIDISNLQIQKI